MRKALEYSDDGIARDLVSHLSQLGRLPGNCDFATIGDLHCVSLYEEFPSRSLIRESVYCGMHPRRETALLKALVECVERYAILEGRNASHPVCHSSRSDGFAAFPVVGHLANIGRARARNNALAEAIERYVWATWWDNDKIGCKVDFEAQNFFEPAACTVLKEIQKLVACRRLIRIQPFLKCDFDVVILFLELEGGGVVSGGAADLHANLNSTILRALGELARHAACAAKILKDATGETFYERRLEYMVRDNTSIELMARVERSGADSISLPKLYLDAELPHSLSDKVYVHRCLFENQPPFVGGNLKRLCL